MGKNCKKIDQKNKKKIRNIKEKMTLIMREKHWKSSKIKKYLIKIDGNLPIL